MSAPSLRVGAILGRVPSWTVGRRRRLQDSSHLVRGRAGQTQALTATDSCRDRLAAFYHWEDRQSLEVAIQIALRKPVDLEAVRKWSHREEADEKFREFLNRFEKRKAKA